MNADGYYSGTAGWIEVICGVMFSGKSEELIRRVRRAIIAKKKVQVFKSHLDERYSGIYHVSSHDGRSVEAVPIDTPEQIAQVRAEYVYSTGPGSQVPATRTDTDHATPHPVGATCIGNLIPNDRTWHNGHTRRQLSVTVDDTGTVTWTSVLGQTRTVTPYDYRTVAPPPDPTDTADDRTQDDDPPPF